jgi:hypothetical protein
MTLGHLSNTLLQQWEPRTLLKHNVATTLEITAETPFSNNGDRPLLKHDAAAMGTNILTHCSTTGTLL